MNFLNLYITYINIIFDIIYDIMKKYKKRFSIKKKFKKVTILNLLQKDCKNIYYKIYNHKISKIPYGIKIDRFIIV